MEKILKIRTVLFLLVSGMLIFFNSCSKVQNTDNYAVVTGRVLNSITDPTGVPGVLVWVESDPASEFAYLGGDVSVTTDQDGVYNARIFLGYLQITDTPEPGGEGTFSVEFPQFVGDARVLMVYRNGFLDLGGGFSLQRGEDLDVWDVYLTDFISMSGDSIIVGGENIGL